MCIVSKSVRCLFEGLEFLIGITVKGLTPSSYITRALVFLNFTNLLLIIVNKISEHLYQ